MDKSRKILSDIVVYSKYARYLPELKRRETWEEIVLRNAEMHARKFPELKDEIYDNFRYVLDKKVLPSMRMLQFAGKPVEINPTRSFNCSYLPADDVAAFSEIMFLLLGGTGVGISVQKHHVDKLPEVIGPKKRSRRHLIGDSIEGWATAVKVLVEAYFYNKSDPIFDYRDIRPKGALLKTSGGKAPGPQPLRDCLHNIAKVLRGAINDRGSGTSLKTIEVHDIVCYIADCVLTGGIRRAALISLFSFDDEDMLTCKFGNWWELNPQRARANNSAVALRHRIKAKDFFAFWEKVKASGCGEPGILFTNSKEYGVNPSLRAGTKVLTRDGIFPIESLEDQKFIVPNLNGKWSEAKCWKSGKDIPLYRLTFDDGSSYYSSPQHKWPIYSNGRYIKCRSDELKENDLLPINNFSRDVLFNGSIGDYDIGLVIGWLYGDGCLTKRSDTGKYVASFVFSKDEEYIAARILSIINKIDSVNRKLQYRDSSIEFQVGSSDFITLIMNKFGVHTKKRGLPSNLWTDWTDTCIRGFIDGLFSSDGHIPKDNHGISLTSSHGKLAEDVRDLLGFYGIKCKIYNKLIKAPSFPNGKTYDKTYTSYIVRSNLSGRKKFRELFNLIAIYKQVELNREIKSRLNNVNNTFMILKKIELTSLKEDVWDISVKDNTHCFQLPTVTTGNCGEVSLRPCQLCNLSTINADDVETQEELNSRARAAAFLGTLQATYTDFHYLRDCWQQTSEKEALLGVSMTGIGSGKVQMLDLKEAAEEVKKENARVAKILGINSAARLTSIKPEGTSSLVLSTSSGIHSWHSPYYIRRMRLNKVEPIYKYLKRAIPELLEDEILRPEIEAILSVPIEAPKNAIFRNEPALDLLERIKHFQNSWITPGHVSGENKHNVSATVSVKDHEWDEVGRWMWDNRWCYNGITVLPWDGGSYVQAPFEECTEEEYLALAEKVRNIDLTKVREEDDNTKLTDQAACAGGNCLISQV